jgi:hypothetical protein
MIQIQCSYCKKEFSKPKNEYNRCVKNNKPMYCSLSCAGKKNSQKTVLFGGKPNRIPPKIKENPFKYYFRNCKRRSQHEFDLDLDYLEELWNKQKGICPYTKLQLILNSHGHCSKDIRYTASLDRIDSSIGYIKGNVQFISTAINYMKSTMSDEMCTEFLLQISKNLFFNKDRTISSPL